MNLTMIIALLCSAILVIQLLLSLFLGADSDIDVDGDSSADFDLSAVFSPKGILHFACGSSWYLVSVGKAVYSLFDYLIAGLIGLGFALLMVGVYWLMYKLQCEKVREEGEALIGRGGIVYTKDSNGNYLINIEINGALSTLACVPAYPQKDYPTGSQVTICKYSENTYYFN